MFRLLYGGPGFESRNAQHLSLGLADKNFGFFPFFAAAGNNQSRAEPVTSTKKNKLCNYRKHGIVQNEPQVKFFLKEEKITCSCSIKKLRGLQGERVN